MPFSQFKEDDYMNVMCQTSALLNVPTKSMKTDFVCVRVSTVIEKMWPTAD